MEQSTLIALAYAHTKLAGTSPSEEEFLKTFQSMLQYMQSTKNVSTVTMQAANTNI
jgi:hypothetical protein